MAASVLGCRLVLAEKATVIGSAGLRTTIEQATTLGVTLACFEAEAPALRWLRTG